MSRRTIKRHRKAAILASTRALNRAAAYVRVSTEEQAMEGVSLDAQLERVRAYAAAQGLEVSEVFRDEGVSAGAPLATRASGARLLAAVRRGEFAHIIALKLDRCFRNAVDCMQTVEEWTHSGVVVHFVDLGGQALDTQSAMGRFFLSIMAACAELELNTIRDRTRTALAFKRARGDRLGTTPVGFHTPAAGAALEPDEVELRAVRRLLELCSKDLPFTRVAAILDAEGYRAKRGGPWQSATVRRVWLARPRYHGLLGPGLEHLTSSASTPNAG